MNKIWLNRALRSTCASAAILSSFCLTVAVAHAQTVATDDAKPQASDAPATDIVVTARKRSEMSINVPMALTVITSKNLELTSSKQLSDLANNIPGLFLQQRGGLQSSFTIRGVGGDARNIGIESGVGVTIDGVGAGRTSGYNLDLARVERIEILKGPQGTLFGTNTIGGAINITTVKPGSKFEFGGSVLYGNYNSIRTTLYATVPLSDTLSIGATVSKWDRDG